MAATILLEQWPRKETLTLGDECSMSKDLGPGVCGKSMDSRREEDCLIGTIPQMTSP
jgi:hypothetical protein